MTQPNMKKEYRAELKSLDKVIARHDRETWWALKKLHEELLKVSATWNRLLARNARVRARLLQRKQILEGRLS